jgi:hypothetical protein
MAFVLAGAGDGVAAAHAQAAAPARIVCTSGSAADRFIPRRAPRRCTLLPRNASFAEGANLARLRWRGWGRRSATATGIERGFHLPFSHIPVAVTAFRLRADRCGRRIRLYTRVRTSSRFGTGTVRLPACSRG